MGQLNQARADGLATFSLQLLGVLAFAFLVNVFLGTMVATNFQHPKGGTLRIIQMTEMLFKR
jgi:hypothetical protein